MLNEKYLLCLEYILLMSNFMMEYLIELGFKHAFTVLQLFSEKLLQQKKVGAEYLSNLSSLKERPNNS